MWASLQCAARWAFTDAPGRWRLRGRPVAGSASVEFVRLRRTRSTLAATIEAPPPARALPRQPPEPLAQPVVEARSRQLRERPVLAAELDVDVLARRQLARRPPVHVD